MTTTAAPGPRARLGAWLEDPRFEHALIALICINAITLGLETWPAAVAVAGQWLFAIDRFVLGVFVVELTLKLIAQGPGFFRRPWNLFDAAIVGVSLAPASGGLAVLRALRVLRLFRLVSAVPRMRMVVESIVHALPGLGAIALLLVLFFYIFAVMATQLFGAAHPGWFGSLPGSLFTLFQIMTLEGWAEVAREVMAGQPLAWIFFIAFILLGTFTVLNLFIAVIVNAMQEQHDNAVRAGDAEPDAIDALREEIAALRGELRAANAALAPGRTAAQPTDG